MPTAAVLTTGCRLNQSESDALRRKLLEQGVTLVADPARADSCFVNTCTVTAAADRSSTQLIRRVCRQHPRPRVVVMGCLAERAAATVRRIPGVSEVWDNSRKQAEIEGCIPSPARSRAFLKVQDGCSRRCRYCVVSGLRGAPRSTPAASVCSKFRRLVADGYQEVVLTGLNLGTYRDVDGTTLAGLLVRLLALPGRFRIRLGSIEPETVDEALLEVLSEPRICPHLHLPLQSGDDNLLRSMDRPCTTTQYMSLLDQLVAQRPDVCLGADVIAGLPGEDEVSFRRTVSFISRSPAAYLHAFSFSPRPGTGAAAMSGVADRSEVRARVGELRRMSDERRKSYEARFAGTVRQAVVESHRTGLTDNYMRLRICALGDLKRGELRDFAIGSSDFGLTGSCADLTNM